MNEEIQLPIDSDLVEDAQDAGLEIATSQGEFFVIIETGEDAKIYEKITSPTKA